MAIDHVGTLHQTTPHARAEIAAGYDAIRQGLKIAEVHALLAVAEAIERTGKTARVTM